jgi:hypothetical protein
MTDRSPERSITQRVPDRPSLKLSRIRQARPRDLAIRFVAGAATSVVSGVLTLVFGARVGGVMLAFPAILAASLTLIEQQENSEEAREDARGAVMGALALALFATVCALRFEKWNPVVVLAVAAGVWLAAATLGYRLAWYGRS